jgi:hypothetical protein
MIPLCGFSRKSGTESRGKRKRPLTIIIVLNCMLVLGNKLEFQFLPGKFLYVEWLDKLLNR